MKRLLLSALAGLSLAASAQAEWGSGYNMGTIGISGGSAEGGTILIDCVEAGNGTVAQGTLTLFLQPMAGTMPNSTSPGEMTFAVDGSAVALAMGENSGDGFVHEMTEASRDALRLLAGWMAEGEELTVLSGERVVARIDLAGAAEALEGLEACLD